MQTTANIFYWLVMASVCISLATAALMIWRAKHAPQRKCFEPDYAPEAEVSQHFKTTVFHNDKTLTIGD